MKLLLIEVRLDENNQNNETKKSKQIATVLKDRKVLR